MTNLEYLRKNANLTQARLSEMSGVPQGKISEYERGITTPGIKAALKLAMALNVTLDTLFADSRKIG